MGVGGEGGSAGEDVEIFIEKILFIFGFSDDPWPSHRKRGHYKISSLQC